MDKDTFDSYDLIWNDLIDIEYNNGDSAKGHYRGEYFESTQSFRFMDLIQNWDMRVFIKDIRNMNKEGS